MKKQEFVKREVLEEVSEQEAQDAMETDETEVVCKEDQGKEVHDELVEDGDDEELEDADSSNQDEYIHEEGEVVDDSEFVFVPGGSQRGRDFLVEKAGYGYNMTRRISGTKYWRCTVKGKKLNCFATITQRGNKFIRGTKPHIHPPKPGLLTKVQVKKKVKATAKEKKNQSAANIVDEILNDEELKASPGLPKLSDLIRTARRIQNPNAKPRKLWRSQLEEASSEDFVILEAGSQRGKTILVEKTGYAYSFKRSVGSGTYWACTLRNKTFNCKATVIQQGDVFKRGVAKHVHKPTPGLLAKKIVTAKVRATAMQNPMESASTIVKEILNGEDPDTCSSLVNPLHLVKTAQRLQKVSSPEGQVRPRRRGGRKKAAVRTGAGSSASPTMPPDFGTPSEYASSMGSVIDGPEAADDHSDAGSPLKNGQWNQAAVLVEAISSINDGHVETAGNIENTNLIFNTVAEQPQYTTAMEYTQQVMQPITTTETVTNMTPTKVNENKNESETDEGENTLSIKVPKTVNKVVLEREGKKLVLLF